MMDAHGDRATARIMPAPASWRMTDSEFTPILGAFPLAVGKAAAPREFVTYWVTNGGAGLK